MSADAGGRAAAAFAALSAALGGSKRESLAAQFNGCVLFDLGAAGKWTLDLRVAAGDKAGVRKGDAGDAAGAAPPDLTLALSEDTFLQLIAGDVEPQSALMNGASRASRARLRARARAL